MSLTSASTLTQVLAAYEDNADYDLVGSATKARDFVQACRILLIRLPAGGSSGATSTTLAGNLTEIRTAMQRAEQWLASNGGTTSGRGGPNVKRASFEDFRQ